MSYMWNEFNIKTFPAETIVFRDGVYCPELSTLENAPINDNFDLPVHIIYVGEIVGENALNIAVGATNQKVIISANVIINQPAFLKVCVKNAGKNSVVTGCVALQNNADLTYRCDAEHIYENTGILIKNKLLAGKNSKSVLAGGTIIKPDCPNCQSDVGFVAMVDKDARVEFMPEQRISSEVESAEHSAAIYRPTENQIYYLRGAGLSGAEVDIALKEAFVTFE